ncbi:MAG TPA: sugar phosphate isomerase/epimerase [Candidatus Dormibacteraeota bacterium]|nr:sugar phosphate isomerase/epimerase [Candidatus Dormibacteraeota bacterium]
MSGTVLGITGLPGRSKRSLHRLALSPSCWGVSEARGWGHQIDAERVLSEAAAVGDGAITAGPPGFLPDRSDRTRPLLRRHRLQVVAGQVHAVLHHHDVRGPELAHIDGHAHWLSAIGAGTLVLAAIPERGASALRPGALSNAEWAHLLHLIGSVQHVCARHRLRLAVQPRFGSIIQGPDDIERLLVGSEAGVCVDIAHLVIAGADPLEVIDIAAGRIQHVQLNDVDLDLARRVRERSVDFDDAVTRNLYRPLGEGGANVARVIEGLRAAKYRGWYTLEQETRLPSADVRPLGRISRSLEYVLPLLG